MSFRSTILAAAALLATSSAHMLMENPTPFSVDQINNDPINAAGFPCKANIGFKITKMNNMAVGAAQQVKLKGSAVHAGGSCQLSITTDKEPTKDSVFKVIKSYEGACPEEGKPLDFTLPASVPNGEATFAWTWFNKIGNREMYMNCAPITITGGASDTAAFMALPDMFTANIGGSCKTADNFAVKFPNPGEDVTKSSEEFLAPLGECGATGGGGTAPPAGSPSAAPSAAPSVPPAGPSPSAPAASNTGGPPMGTGVPSVPSSAPVTPPTGGNSCTTEGAIICIGSNQFGICANGVAVPQALAAGTTCSNGNITKRGYNGRIARPRI
ncbi:hypothetical protein BDV95DRAFT_501619 [Massariosphaeria phaeospora]|uniref:Lytic polysaccharide monooxygenase n=1 Tax=Massariosphaeria phaeospora TaxID=100035 RepID=A0A7C8M441_9PLEO|nr:hypothetical protein BDV95DRAFT_501619 [Massariosphaeria phaeospora]